MISKLNAVKAQADMIKFIPGMVYAMVDIQGDKVQLMASKQVQVCKACLHTSKTLLLLLLQLQHETLWHHCVLLFPRLRVY